MKISLKDKSRLRGKKVLLTGASGFIGSHLAREFLKNNCEVTALIRPSSDLWRIKDVKNNLRLIKCDLAQINPIQLKSKLSRVDILVHVGAEGVNQSNQDISSILQTNILGTHQILELARLLKVKRFIYCGSCFEYSGGNRIKEQSALNPVSEYGLSKLSGGLLTQIYSKRFQLPVVWLRPFTAFGPFESKSRLIPHVILKGMKGLDLRLTGGEQKRDFIFIEDVVSAFMKASVADHVDGLTFNVSSGHSHSVKDTVKTILKLMTSVSKPLWGTVPYRPQEIWTLSGDPSLAKRQLDWKAQYSFNEGLRKTISWFKENHHRYHAYQEK